MSIELELRSNASRSDTLAAIRKFAPQWRESSFPPHLKKTGILSIEIFGNDDSFQLRYVRPGRGSKTVKRFELELRGDVMCDTNNNTWVHIRCGVRKFSPAEALWWLWLGALSLLAPPFMRFVYAAGAVAFSASRYWQDDHVNERNLEANYLVERIKLVVDNLNALHDTSHKPKMIP